MIWSYLLAGFIGGCVGFLLGFLVSRLLQSLDEPSMIPLYDDDGLIVGFKKRD